MTDEELITNYLNRFHEVVCDVYTINDGKGFLVFDKITKGTEIFESVENKLITIFGSIKGLNKVYKDWFTKQANELIKDILDFFKTLDPSERGIKLVEKCEKRFKHNSRYNGTKFILNRFYEWYNEKFLIPRLDAFITTFDTSLGSDIMLVQGSVVLDGETLAQFHFAKRYYDQWYYKNVFETKIRDFVDKCEIVLGKSDWEIKHKELGVLDEHNLHDYFIGEDQYQIEKLRGIFFSWVDNTKVDKSYHETKNL